VSLPAGARAFVPGPVIQTAAVELQPAAASGYLAYSRTTLAHPNRVALLVEPDGRIELSGETRGAPDERRSRTSSGGYLADAATSSSMTSFHARARTPPPLEAWPATTPPGLDALDLGTAIRGCTTLAQTRRFVFRIHSAVHSSPPRSPPTGRSITPRARRSFAAQRRSSAFGDSRRRRAGNCSRGGHAEKTPPSRAPSCRGMVPSTCSSIGSTEPAQNQTSTRSRCPRPVIVRSHF
jgi:hypothetical protein